jgi:hypothetical protein
VGVLQRWVGVIAVVASPLNLTGQESPEAARQRVDRLSQAFWQSPSLARFEAVGMAMNEALPAAIREAEFLAGQAARPAVPPFDAMKARLSQGIVAEPRYPSGNPQAFGGDPLSEALKRAPLPSPRPSFFGKDDILFAEPLRPFELVDTGQTASTLADALSAFHRVQMKIRVMQPASYAHWGLIGMWDISVVDVAFDRPVMVHAITARGTVTGVRISSLAAPVGDYGCAGASKQMEARPLNTAWRSAAVAWVGKAPERQASIASRQLGGRGKYDKLVIDAIDLDSDGAADFLVYSGIAPPVVQTETFWKAVIGNIAGRWVPLGFSQESDCT